MSAGCCTWMQGDFGVSAHWTPYSALRDGTVLPFEEAVNRFDTEAFADSLQSVGAGHCILTFNHGWQYLPLPCPVLDAILPGRTTRRDMIAELIESLSKRNIRLIAYYNHACNGGDDNWTDACGFSAGIHGNLDLFAERICSIVSYMGTRYGKGISAWWFDSSYTVDPRGPFDATWTELGDWQFPWKKLYDAGKAGNPERAVTFNAGVGKRYLYLREIDYYAGETVHTDEVFEPEALPDIQDTRWICQDDPAWVFTADTALKKGFMQPQFTDEQLSVFCREHLSAGRMVTMNILVDQAGNFNPFALEQLRRIRFW